MGRYVPAAVNPNPKSLRRRVASEQSGLRLDVYLSRQDEVDGRALAKSMCQQGLVQVDGKPSKAGMVLTLGQTVIFVLPEVIPVADLHLPGVAEIQIPILFEDDYLLVIHKPAGMASHPAGALRGSTQRMPTVSEWAQHNYPNLPVIGGEDRPGIVHRLDKDTSGVMALVKNEEAFHFVKAQFQARAVQKEYLAIAFGESRFDSDYIDRNIATHPKHGDRRVVVEEGGRTAQTFYEVVQRFSGFTYFRCLPKTGRTHQIRVHMMSIGHSLVGDRLYRSRKRSHSLLPADAPDPGRQCLHATVLSLRHPHSHADLSFAADLPADMTALLSWLQKQS